jgi:hypothetical protein
LTCFTAALKPEQRISPSDAQASSRAPGRDIRSKHGAGFLVLLAGGQDAVAVPVQDVRLLRRAEHAEAPRQVGRTLSCHLYAPP